MAKIESRFCYFFSFFFFIVSCSSLTMVSAAFLFSKRVSTTTAAAAAAASLRRSLLSSKSSSSPRLFMSTDAQSILDSVSARFSDGASASSSFSGGAVASAMECLASADAVCFDVDSTVLAEEGIDVLADYLGKGPAVAELTRNAMEGATKFQDALARRLELMEPSRASILRCLQDRPLVMSPGIEALVEALHEAKKDVYLVSGGFRIMIEPIARDLCISKTNIYANTIFFDDGGNYAGFDDTEPTSQDMGKPRALELIQQEHGYETMVMVGDGATDAQAKPPAKAFIGYGGVVVREAVKEKACWFVTNFEEMEYVVREFGTKK